jgi:hypothetical protein
MFAGHVGAALAIGRADRRVNVGVLVFAALLLDVVLWILILLGGEFVVVPPDFSRTHQVAFNFPYSHSLVGTLVWAALAAIGSYAWYSHRDADRYRPAALVAAAIFSHWLLDAVVHVPELPLVGNGSPKVGLSLWNNMPVALAVEGLCVLVGLALFLRGTPLSRTRARWLAVLVMLTFAFTVIGLTVAPAPPSATVMASSSLLTILAVVALATWAGAGPRSALSDS